MSSDGEILQSYDRHERREVNYHDMRRVEGPGWVRMDHQVKSTSLILYACLAAADLGAAVDRHLEFARASGRDLEWKVFGHDRPEDTVVRLEERGFGFGALETLMFQDVQSPCPALLAPPDRLVRKLSLEEGLEPFVEVVSEVSGLDFGEFGVHLAAARKVDPYSVSVYVGYEDGLAVSAAWSNLTPGSPFVGFYGGSTREAYRGRGFYRALVRERALEAMRRDRRYLIVEALPASRAILERMGFRAIGWSREGHWCGATGAASETSGNG